jgi:hypothetical protein
MARVELRDDWTVNGDVEDALKTARAFLKKSGMTIVDSFDDEIRFSQGSSLWTRLFGGWFVSAATLPKMGTATFKRTKSGVRVRVKIEETLGFGVLDPLLHSKYEEFFKKWMDDFAADYGE